MCAGTMDNRCNILICVTASVAAIKIPLIIQILTAKAQECKKEISIRICMTNNSLHFCPLDDIKKENVDVFLDHDEWSSWKSRGDPVLHIDLTKWAHIMLIAPLDANSLAKIANGLCDNLVTCCVRAWDQNKPLLFCPAMNTKMWNHPITSTHISTLVTWGYKHLPPISKTLMCGDTGVGAMMEPQDIVNELFTHL